MRAKRSGVGIRARLCQEKCPKGMKLTAPTNGSAWRRVSALSTQEAAMRSRAFAPENPRRVRTWRGRAKRSFVLLPYSAVSGTRASCARDGNPNGPKPCAWSAVASRFREAASAARGGVAGGEGGSRGSVRSAVADRVEPGPDPGLDPGEGCALSEILKSEPETDCMFQASASDFRFQTSGEGNQSGLLNFVWIYKP
jgi:hypothetical protein